MRVSASREDRPPDDLSAWETREAKDSTAGFQVAVYQALGIGGRVKTRILSIAQAMLQSAFTKDSYDTLRVGTEMVAGIITPIVTNAEGFQNCPLKRSSPWTALE
jgi:hypothetical protein